MLDRKDILKNAKLYRILSDPYRLIIVNLLAEQSMNLSELHEEVSIRKSEIIDHLSILKDNNIVRCENGGENTIYHLLAPSIVDACHIMKKVQSTTQDMVKERVGAYVE